MSGTGRVRWVSDDGGRTSRAVYPTDDAGAFTVALGDVLGPAQRGRNRAQITRRELEILRAYAVGLSTREIADHLAISSHTVYAHVKNARRTLGARSRAEAVAMVVGGR